MTNRVIAVSAWLVVALIVFATLSPLSLRPHAVESANVERLVAYSLAGLLLGLAYPRYFLWAVILVVALAAGLEALQNFIPDRHGHLSDMTVKATGGIVGVFIAGLILKLKPKI